MSFTEQQPKDGDVIMHCGHLDGGTHWFQYETPIKFTRPNGSYGESAWFAACQRCYMRHGDQAPRHVQGDGRWKGDAPIIEEDAKA